MEKKEHASGLPSKLPPGLTSSTDSIISDWLCSHRISRIIKYNDPSEKYTIPVTTSSEIGWPWRHVQHTLGVAPDPDLVNGKESPGPKTLERFGAYARGRGDVMKWFGGCRESLP